jgi:telomerase reverse transcriptase
VYFESQFYESSIFPPSNLFHMLNRYLNNHLCSALTVCWQGKPGRRLKAKLCGFMRPKCHPIFFDSNINSAAVVRLNIYQAFLVCAMKFHCYVCDLSCICKLRAGFYLHIIERSLRYGCNSCLSYSICC